MKRRHFDEFMAALFGITALVFSGCANQSVTMQQSKRSLYDRLGGETAIKTVVNDFVDRTAANPKVNFARKGTDYEWQATPENVKHVKEKLVEQICAASGGSQKYTGRDMKSVHRGMMISNTEFDALAADLIATLDKFKIPKAEKDELLQIVGGLRGDVVGVK